MDGRHERFITSASSAVESFCRRTFASTAHTETRDGTGLDHIYLWETPITALTSVTITDTSDGSEDSISTDEFQYDEDTGKLRFKPWTDGASRVWDYFPSGFQNLSIAYTAGYSTIPEVVQEATAQLAAAYANTGNRDASMQSESIGGYSYTIAATVGAGGIPKAVAAMLAPYRKGGVY